MKTFFSPIRLLLVALLVLPGLMQKVGAQPGEVTWGFNPDVDAVNPTRSALTSFHGVRVPYVRFDRDSKTAWVLGWPNSGERTLIEGAPGSIGIPHLQDGWFVTRVDRLSGWGHYTAMYPVRISLEVRERQIVAGRDAERGLASVNLAIPEGWTVYWPEMSGGLALANGSDTAIVFGRLQSVTTYSQPRVLSVTWLSEPSAPKLTPQRQQLYAGEATGLMLSHTHQPVSRILPSAVGSSVFSIAASSRASRLAAASKICRSE